MSENKTNRINHSEEIYRRFGSVKRARGCFLYTAKGVRITDLFQEGGKAILGWGGGSAFTQFKNVLSRGITGCYVTDFTGRLQKAVSELLASPRKIFVFADRNSAMEAAEKIAPENNVEWKPWSDSDVLYRNVTAVVIEPPLPWGSSHTLLAVKDEDDMQTLPYEPVSEKLPAPLEAAVTRSIYDMIAALQSRQEKDWFLYDTVLTKYWKRKGPYLYPLMNETDYEGFFYHCIERGILISPEYSIPSIVPFGADKGVFSALKKEPYDWKKE